MGMKMNKNENCLTSDKLLPAKDVINIVII